MKTIEFTDEIRFGEQQITAIKVAPLKFAAFSQIWDSVSADAAARKDFRSKAMAIMQRRRIVHQAHFMAGDKRVQPEEHDILTLPLGTAKKIIAVLEDDEGTAGKLLNDGDGATVPVHYQLGNPITMKSAGKPDVVISELEFKAMTYGDMEDVLAVNGDVPQTIELIRRIGKPVEVKSLTTLPSWAIDQISVADGVTIMNHVLPRFLG